MPEEITKACEYPHLAKGGDGCPYKKSCGCQETKKSFNPGHIVRKGWSKPRADVNSSGKTIAHTRQRTTPGGMTETHRRPVGGKWSAKDVSGGASKGGSSGAPGGGWAIIPTGKKGGYRRKKGKGYEYWYPGQKGGPGGKGGGGGEKAPTHESKGSQYREDLKEYNLEIVAGSDGKLSEGDIERAQDIAKKVRSGALDAANVCNLSPPVCTDNKGIPRSQMPQITETPLKAMKSAMGDEEYNGWMKKGGWSAVKKKAAEGGGKGADKQSVRGMEKGKPLDAKDRFEARMKADAAIAVGGDPYTNKSVMDMFLDKLGRQGIKSKTEKVPVGRLKATQKEIQAGKTYGMADAFLKGKFRPQDAEILISSDGYILDGHHRYAALITAQPDILMNVKRVDMKMDDFLVASFKMQGVFRADLDGAVVDPKTPHDLSGSSTKKSLIAWAQAHPVAGRELLRKARAAGLPRGDSALDLVKAERGTQATFTQGSVTYHHTEDQVVHQGGHPTNRSLHKAAVPEMIDFGPPEAVDLESLTRVDGVLMHPNGVDRRS